MDLDSGGTLEQQRPPGCRQAVPVCQDAEAQPDDAPPGQPRVPRAELFEGGEASPLLVGVGGGGSSEDAPHGLRWDRRALTGRGKMRAQRRRGGFHVSLAASFTSLSLEAKGAFDP